MKLLFPDPLSRPAINVTRLKKCGYDLKRIIADRAESLVALVVLANGTPDDTVLGVLSYHLDGARAIGVVKPTEKKNLPVLYELKTYLALRVNRVMVLIDQEELLLNDFFARSKKIMKKIGISLESEEDKGRVRLYQCSLASKKFEIIIVVNGLSEVCTDKHNIEDHLTKAAGIEVNGNSKDAWNSLSLNRRNDVFRELKEKRREIEELFPQQVCGLKLLTNEN